MSLDPLIRIPSSHVGASKSLQGRLTHHLDPVLLLLVSNWECSEIGTSFSISWITFCHVALDYSFHSMSLACFLPRAFVSLSWLGTSFHFVVTCLMLWDMFIDHIFTPYIYHGPSTPFFVWSLIQFSTRCSYCHYGKVKDTFTLFSRELPWSPYHFSLTEIELKVESRICGYRWSTDLVIVCFSHLFSPGLLMETLWSHL